MHTCGLGTRNNCLFVFLSKNEGKKINISIEKKKNHFFLLKKKNLLYVMYLVLAISTGMEAAVVTSPLIILAQKWRNIPSWNQPETEMLEL